MLYKVLFLQRARVLRDVRRYQLAKRFYSCRIARRNEPPNLDGFDETRQKLEFAPTLRPIEQASCIAVSDEREKRVAALDWFDPWRGSFLAVSDEINRGQRKWLVGEAIAIQLQEALVPGRADARQSVC